MLIFLVEGCIYFFVLLKFVLLKFVNDIEVIKNICYFIKMEE